MTAAELLLAQIETEGVSGRVQIVAVIVTVLLLGLVIELVRRRRLIERYALLWIVAALAMVVLAVWRRGLDVVADAFGIADPPNALFTIAFGVVFALLLHFSVAISRLGEEAKILAQEVARLDVELRRERGELPEMDGQPGGAQGDQAAGREPPAPSSARATDQ